jgi:16S rRNA G966 N2-methylase RsmD
MNRLYFGDNLKWLSDRKEFPDASIDLVYLDPPFNSNADYNWAAGLRLISRLDPQARAEVGRLSGG